MEVANPYKILEFLKIIGKHKESANYMKETNIGLLIFGWTNKIVLYNNSSYKKENEEKIYNHNIFEINPDQKKEYELFVCFNGNEGSKKLIFQIDNIYQYKLSDIKNIKTRVCIQFNKDCIICNEKGLFQINDFSSNIDQSKEISISTISYWNGIKLDSNIAVFTSNKILNNGEDEIIFYNYYNKKNVFSIKNYSFALSQNNLAKITIEENRNIILLCACKKYKKSQKNGILLLKLDLRENNLYKTFYDTKNNEVNCFCQIFEFTEFSYIDNKKNKMKETNYFLVGGFNKEQNGFIKLYKMNYNEEEFEKTEIEYIQDIKIKKNFNGESNNFHGFKGNITFIGQSKYNGNIFVGCSDGSIHLLTFPNISSFENLFD